jgi:hypothetical protein
MCRTRAALAELRKRDVVTELLAHTGGGEEDWVSGKFDRGDRGVARPVLRVVLVDPREIDGVAWGGRDATRL